MTPADAPAIARQPGQSGAACSREAAAFELLTRLFLAREWDESDLETTVSGLRQTGYSAAQLEVWLVEDIAPIFGSNLSGYDPAPESLGWLRDDVLEMVERRRRRRSRHLASLGAALRHAARHGPLGLPRVVRTRWTLVHSRLNSRSEDTPVPLRDTPWAAERGSHWSREEYERMDRELEKDVLPLLRRQDFEPSEREGLALQYLANLFAFHRISAREQATHAAVLRRTGYETAQLQEWLVRDIAPLFSRNLRGLHKTRKVLGWPRGEVLERVQAWRVQRCHGWRQWASAWHILPPCWAGRLLPSLARRNWLGVRALLEKPPGEAERTIALRLDEASGS